MIEVTLTLNYTHILTQGTIFAGKSDQHIGEAKTIDIEVTQGNSPV